MARTLAKLTLPPIQTITTMADLGLAVRAARTGDALRIDTAADLCQVSVALLSALENGTDRAVRIDKILQVLDGLGLTLLVATKQAAEQIVESTSSDSPA